MINNQQFRLSPWLTSSMALLLGICTTPCSIALSDQPKSKTSEPVSLQQLPLGFSIEKMDTTVDPKKDFHRFAAGKWLDAAKIPPDQLSISGIALLAVQVSQQLEQITQQSVAQSTKAAKGSPLQQVGDLYASGMDVKQLESLGVSPLKPLFDRVQAIDSPQQLTKTLAQLQIKLNKPIIVQVGISPDPQNNKINTIALIGGTLGLPSQEDYLSPNRDAIRKAYLDYVTEALAIAGSSPAEATSAAKKILEIETRIASKQLTPAEFRDPNRRMKKMSFAQLQSLLSNLDMKLYFQELKLPTTGNVVVVDPGSLVEINQILKEYPLNDIKTYLRWGLLNQNIAYLTPAFEKPLLAFKKVYYGKEFEFQSRSKRVTALISEKYGHPLSQLYVKKHFSPEAKKQVEGIIQQIKTLFRARLEANKWLTDATRKSALEKIDRVVIKVGYPEKWIDYSSVDIRRDDFFGNVIRTNEFLSRRDLSRFGKPVTNDEFDVPNSTLPIVVNAAYDSTVNGIEIPAAFLQPPFFDPKGDAAVNFCSMGAVIGHEITHGFDSQGRLYNAQGNLQNWWTDQDAAKFVAQTDKLVKQADAFEVLPGVRLNGKLTVGENLADVGGVSLAYQALEQYLQKNPQANQKINGYTPQQRCFIAWSQLWATKVNEGALRQNTATDGHPVGAYRGIAPLQHEDGFFKAFDIKPGDPMWRDEKDRVKIW
ncbi:M13 family metallopeptidase [Nostoc sp. FACHB-152]|uniref:M13 family metallopeptidase n=1 Tax=unclassified Nostoc TaxID=2593658 RepID=UPI001685DDF7|nr:MULTISPECIES: M13 family metallopeptidase [unclassified Nostoc]MBD2450730.1 M13 family metallopeptidase [Nostoc sp. FACHB-152]MBD2471942.1 M13 family metallopeptidase [Nostoc sp. FACHB-145]